MSAIRTSPKTRIAEFFRAKLDSDEIHFFQNNADSDSPPPYGVITVTKLEETTPNSDVFTAEIKLAVITSIDMSSSQQHDELLESVMERLRAIPRQVFDADLGIRVYGWVVIYSEAITKDESQSFSDVMTIQTGFRS